MKMKKEENAIQPPSYICFEKEDFNPEIGEALIEKMIELDLLPSSREDLGFRFVQYFPHDQLLDWRSKIAREIVRKRPDVKLGDLLTTEEKELISDVAKGKSEKTQFTSPEVRQEFENVCRERGLSIDGRWFLRWWQGNKERFMGWTPCGYAAEALFNAILYKGNKDPDSNYPRRFLEMLKTPLRDIAKFSPSFNIPSPNTHQGVKWTYVDETSGGIMPPIELCKQRIKPLKELNLVPFDPHFWLRIDGGSKEREKQYKEEYLPEADGLKKMGVSAEVFEKLGEFWFHEGFKDADKKGEKLNQSFFFIAYLLRRDHPSLYSLYLKEVRDFVLKMLIPEKVESLRAEKEILEKKLCGQKSRMDSLSENAGTVSRLPEKKTKSVAIGSGLSIKHRKDTHQSGNLTAEPEVITKEQDTLRDIEREYERKRKQWIEETLKNEAHIIKFKAWLSKDFLLVCVFFTYVLDGMKKLKLERPSHRPSNKIFGEMIVYLVNELTPYFEDSPEARKNKAQVHRAVSRLMSGLTGENFDNKKVKGFYYRYSHKSTQID